MSDSASQREDVSVAVVTGQHPYDAWEFTRLFEGLPGVRAYHQSLGNFIVDWGDASDRYDAVVFYHFHQHADELAHGDADRLRAAVQALGDRGQGIVVLHHALTSFPDLDLWTDVCGLAARDVRSPSFDFDQEQDLRVEPTAADHPVVSGVDSWEMVEETYRTEEPGPDNEVVLATEHPRSMRALGWTRTFRNARVFSLQPGHDGRAFSHPRFRTVLGNGIQWVARRS